MRPYATLMITGFLLLGDATAEMPERPSCPFPSNVDAALSELKRSIILGLVELSDEWQTKLKDASKADDEACQHVANAMYDWVDKTIELLNENNRLREERNNLNFENMILKDRFENSD